MKKGRDKDKMRWIENCDALTNLLQVALNEPKDHATINQREAVMNKEGKTGIQFTSIIHILDKQHIKAL